MPGANNPHAAKSAAILVNPTSAAMFTPLLSNPVITTAPFAAYTDYQVFNNAVSTTTQTAVLNSSVGSNVNAAAFLVRAYGRVTGGTTTNFTPTLLFGRSTAYASNTVLGSLTASAFNSASGMFYLTAQLFWDATSGVISGSIQGFNGSTSAIIAAALVTPVTGQTSTVLNAAVTNPGLFFFSVAGLFSASNASNQAILDYLAVEDI
jgi:hypothetical protein